MKLTRRSVILAGGAAAATLATPFVASARLPRNVRMVIGSTSTGGDTYQNSSIVADALAAPLVVGGIALSREPAPGAPFETLRRYLFS